LKLVKVEGWTENGVEITQEMARLSPGTLSLSSGFLALSTG
jgi:hypothetical protein